MINNSAISFWIYALFVVSLIFIAKFYGLLAYGYDITDEGFYLFSVEHPSSYSIATSQFGFLLHPLWLLSGENILIYRRLIWLLTMLLAWSMFYSLLSLPHWRAMLPFHLRCALAVILSCSVFALLQLWLPTPNYNTLALISILVFANAVSLSLVNEKAVFKIGILIGISGWLAFLSKPPVAICLALVSCLIFVKIRSSCSVRAAFTVMIISLITSLSFLFLFIVIVFGEFTTYFSSLFDAVKIGKLLLGEQWVSSSSLLWRGGIGYSNMHISLYVSLICTCTLLMCSSFLIEYSSNRSQLRRIASLLMAIIMVSILLSIVGIVLLEYRSHAKHLTTLDHLLIGWALPSTVIISYLLVQVLKREIRLCELIISLVFALLAYCYTVGTANNYYSSIAMVPIFGIAACVAVVKRIEPILVLGLWAVFNSAYLLPIGGDAVYRQPSFGSNKFVDAQIAPLKGLRISVDVNNYFASLHELSVKGGFVKGGGIIDLTGASPGSLFAIEAKSTGAAWMLGGYLGSYAAAKERLNSVSSLELAGSWVLVEDWSRAIDERVLNDFGLSLKDDYFEVGRVILPAGYGGRNLASEQALYRPKKYLEVK